MIKTFLLYMAILFITILNFKLAMRFRGNKPVLYIFLAISFIFPLLLSGLRGVGTDYKSYVSIYNNIGTQTILEYVGSPNSYVEFGYYLINRFSYAYFDSFIPVFFIISFLTLFFIFKTLLSFKSTNYAWVGLYIFFQTLYPYSFNGSRQALTVAICCYAYIFLIRKDIKKYILMVLVATLFHKTAWVCLIFIFLIYIKNIKLNLLRNTVFYTAICLSPIILTVLLKIGENIPIFQRYYEVYQVNYGGGGLGFLQYVIPLIPLVFIFKKDLIKKNPNMDVLYNIILLQIPFLYAGYFSQWASRLEWYAVIAYMILIPLILDNMKSKRNKYMLIMYYVTWYFVSYCINYIYLGRGELYPYQSIFIK